MNAPKLGEQFSEFTCTCCKGVFLRGQTPEDVLKEMQKNKFEPELYPCVEVCDKCYKRIMGSHAS